MSVKEKWQIYISGYGQFPFEGTELEAEEMRAHKAHWEGGIGRKWRDDGSELAKLEQEISTLFANGDGVPQSMLTKIRRLKDIQKKKQRAIRVWP